MDDGLTEWVAVGVGSNLGDRARNLAFAVTGLRELLDPLEVSRVYESEPVLVVDQPPFLNACCAGRARMTPRQLFSALKDLEIRAGRTPGGVRYGPRVLDLDLLLYGERIVVTPDLVVPHPRLLERPFVLVPLAEIAHDRRVPDPAGGAARTVGDHAANADRGALTRTNIELEEQ